MTKENISQPEEHQFGNEFLLAHRNVIISTRISTLSPLIIYPLLSLYFHDWLLLLGIVFSHLGGLLSIKKIWIIVAMVITISNSLIYGFIFDSYVNIFFLCYTYGHITFSIGRFYLKKFEDTKVKIQKQINSLHGK
jgi:hypothetical protein